MLRQTSRVKLNPFPNEKKNRLFQTEEFADDNFKFDENSKKFSKRVENTVGKGEIGVLVRIISTENRLNLHQRFP